MDTRPPNVAREDRLLDEWRLSVNESINELREGQGTFAVALSKVQENMIALDARMKRVENSPAAWRGWLNIFIAGCLGPALGFVSALVVGVVVGVVVFALTHPH